MKKHNTFWVGLSGGVDSIVLLHFLKNNVDFNYTIKAIHINHQLHPNASQWADFCQKICTDFNIPLKIIKLHSLKNINNNIESRAREARYNAFKKIIKKNDFLVTAHHEEDQAETVLLQLFRGAGLRGVSAMPGVKKFHQGYLYRPFLNTSRAFIRDYANFYQLNWMEDPSNTIIKFDRNFLRHEIFPRLTQRWPAIHKTLARFSRHCWEQENLVNNHTNTAPPLKNKIRKLLQQHEILPPSEKILNEIIRLAQAKKDAMPVIKWSNLECRRYQNRLYFYKNKKKQHSLTLTSAQKKWCQENLPNQEFTIKFRQGGEKFKPKNNLHTRTLKNLFQEWKIPPWERSHVPLAYDKKNQLIAVIGYAV